MINTNCSVADRQITYIAWTEPFVSRLIIRLQIV